MNNEVIFSVSDFVAVFNQTIEYVYPTVSIVGELSNFKISKGKWIYFDLKDEQSSVRFFGTTYALPGPLEDGMVVQVTGTPRLHNTFGFSVNVKTIRPIGEGALKRAADLLRAKLRAEGLFAAERKQALPYPPQRIGLVASGESAAYADFLKILNARWGGIEILHAESQVQGEAAVRQIVAALDMLNAMGNLDVIVITRGGGSADDLAAFNTEQVVRTIAASRVPTLVAIGHEIDESLSELVADMRASTPSNAAELLTPDRTAVLLQSQRDLQMARTHILHTISQQKSNQQEVIKSLSTSLTATFQELYQEINQAQTQLNAYDPRRILRNGYAALRKGNHTITSIKQLHVGEQVDLRLGDGSVSATVNKVY